MNKVSPKTKVNLRHLQACLAVAANGSFTSAAESLGVVTSALSETIRQIEDETGVVLFDRKSRPIAPTAAGRHFLAEAELITRHFEGTLDALRRTGGLEGGHVTVATIPSALTAYLVPALANLRKKRLGIRATVLDGIGEFAETMVLTGQAEIGLCARWNSDLQVQGTLLARDHYRLVCHRDHELARKRGEVRLGDLEHVDVIGLGTGNAIALQLAAHASLPFSVRNPSILTHSTVAQQQFVASNLGVAVLPEMAARTFGRNEIVCIPISDLDLAREVFLIRKPKSEASPVAKILHEEIINSATQQTG